MNHNNPNNNQSAFLSAIKGFSTTIAIIATLIGAPLLGLATEEYVAELAEHIYGDEFIWMSVIVWKVLCFPLIFYAAKASFTTAIMVAATGFALRFV